MTAHTHSRKTAVYTSEQVRELDRIAIEEFATPGYELMTRAAQVTFELIQQHWPQVGHMCVLCGTGNNAGDGYVTARLALYSGWQVTLYSLVATECLRGDAAQACRDFVAAGGVVRPWQTEDADSTQYTVLVDALLGTGLTRDVSGVFAEAVSWINAMTVPVVSIDIPSGLDGDTGQVRGCAVKATHTVTYIGMKQGLLTGQARDYTGLLHFDALGVRGEVYTCLPIPVRQWLITAGDIVKGLPPRARCTHKGSFGHSLLLGGNQGMSGAIRLAGEAALRTGSGLVTLATHPAHADWVNQNRPELMVARMESAADLRQQLTGKMENVALGFGPGLGQDQWARQLFLLAVEACVPLVVDADALNLLAKLPRRQDNWILTPHPAEAARLLGCTTNDIEKDRVAAVRLIQERFGGVCILKGAGTLVSNGDEVAFCAMGNPGMASGGMGDVLSGIITALLAQQLGLFQAAYIGVQVHAMAADNAAKAGERGMVASDVIAQLRGVVNP